MDSQPDTGDRCHDKKVRNRVREVNQLAAGIWVGLLRLVGLLGSADLQSHVYAKNCIDLVTDTEKIHQSNSRTSSPVVTVNSVGNLRLERS